MKKTDIYAHRGSKGTHPENTLAAFKEAVRLGVDGIELDVHLTKDGELAVIHDETVDRTTDGTGKVSELTMAQIKQLDAGSWFANEFCKERVPTLGEVLELLKDTGIKLNVEIKNDRNPYVGIEEKVLSELERYDYKDQSIISSFNHYSLKKVHELDPEVEAAILFMEVLYEPWNYAASVGAKALHVYLPVALTKISAEAAKNDVPVRVFTVNKEEDMRQLMAMEVDAIMTDFPERAMRLRDS